MTKKRGAQPGNKNAHKHGFYSSHFKANERRILSQISLTDMSGEIELIRVSLKRFADALDEKPPSPDFQTQSSILRQFTLSADSINSMVRTQIITALANKDSKEILAQLQEMRFDEDADLKIPDSQE